VLKIAHGTLGMLTVTKSSVHAAYAYLFERKYLSYCQCLELVKNQDYRSEYYTFDDGRYRDVD
jgi:hypothetical protein